ncbi:MAG: penicillin-binding protein 2 [Gammaproteobacteria bacterium]|nr:penicillin-binding protein 2 [Gammaproteobacteria bacterium]
MTRPFPGWHAVKGIFDRDRARQQAQLKDVDQERRDFASRTLVVFFIVAVMCCVLTARMVWLTVFKHDEYRTISEDNRIQMFGVPPPRGRIYDRTGILLADNVPVFSIFVIPELTDNVDATLSAIAALVELSDEEIDAFHTLASESFPHSPVRVRPQITPEERAVIEVNRHRLSGVQVRPDTVRHYPYGEVMAHAVGSVRRKTAEDIRRLDRRRYSRTQFVGKRGVEAFYEHSLHGEPGSRQVEVDALGREQRELGRNPPRPGWNLTLHLDASLQVAAAQALGERRGAVVAIDPRSGGILALASVPGYDPNLFVTGMDPAVYDELVISPNKPLFNRAANGRYAPGSTFKPIVGLAALAHGVTDWERTIVDNDGVYRLPNNRRQYRDWTWTKDNPSGQGVIDLHRAIYRSSNIYFYGLGDRLPVDSIPRFAAQFGYGRVLSIDVAGAEPGLLPDSEWKMGARGEGWYPGDNLNLAIGQGDLLATPLQLATVASIIANRGRVVRPRMLLNSDAGLPELENGELTVDFVALGGIEAGPASGSQNEHAGTRPGDAGLRPEDAGLRSVDWQRMVDAMEAVVHRGNQGYRENGTAWAYIGQDIAYRMAGKSGTAQVVGIAQGEEYDEEELDEFSRKHAWFIAFAPVDDPRIAVSVLVENGGSGSAVAGPVAREVLDHYLLPELAAVTSTATALASGSGRALAGAPRPDD